MDMGCSPRRASALLSAEAVTARRKICWAMRIRQCPGRRPTARHGTKCATPRIDQSFVRQITTAPDETTMVTAVISMGRSLKLRVVAEGVETQQELEFLQAQQCDEAQGYYFSRPVVAEQFAKLLKTGIPEASVVVHR